MRYLRWTIGTEITGRSPNRRLVDVYTEVDDTGHITREVGTDSAGRVVHRAPSTDDRYGLFDNQVVRLTVDRESDIDPETFERMWRG